MDESKVEGMIKEAIDPLAERLQVLDKLEEAFGKFDPAKIDELTQKLEGLEGISELPTKVEELEKNVQKINAPIEQEREELVKNLKTNQDIISEDSLVKMNIEDLRKLDQKYQKTPNGSFGVDTSGEDIVAQINAEYGTNVGATLGEDS
jgi:DNA repair ATPase RecN